MTARLCSTSTAEEDWDLSSQAEPALSLRWPMQEVQREQQLGSLTPKRDFIPVQTLERAIVELGKSQEAAGHRPIFIAGAIDGRFELRLRDVTCLDPATRGIGVVRISKASVRYQFGERNHC